MIQFADVTILPLPEPKVGIASTPSRPWTLICAGDRVSGDVSGTLGFVATPLSHSVRTTKPDVTVRYAEIYAGRDGLVNERCHAITCVMRDRMLTAAARSASADARQPLGYG